MHLFKAAILVLGLVAVALPASGKTVPESGNEQSYQLFNKQRTHRGRRADDDVGSGRVISQDLINRFNALKNPSSGTTTIITSPTTTTITLSPTTTSPTTTSPTSTTSPTTSPTTITNNTSRAFVGFANLDDEDAFENDEDDSPIVLQQLNRYSMDKYDHEEDVEDDVAIADTAVEYGRAARARPSNRRRRQQRQRQQQRRRRRQAMRRRQRRQRLRRQQRRRNQQRRRKAGSRQSVRRGNGGRNRRRRRIVRVNV